MPTCKAQPDRERVNILGVGVHATNRAGATAAVERALDSGAKGYICLTGVHGIMEAQRDPELRTVLNRALLVAPDGMPTVWLGRFQGFRSMSRVFGPEFMLDLCGRSVRHGWQHFLYGGAPGVAEQLRSNLENWFPGIQVLGTHTPPFRPLSADEERRLEDILQRLRPDIMWVGLSTPNQELFMARYLHRLSVRLMIGVGAAFDLHTGRIQDAPGWMKRSGLQWLHRLLQEPRRLWKRYLLNNPRFLCRVSLQLAGLTRHELSQTPCPPSLRDPS